MRNDVLIKTYLAPNPLPGYTLVTLAAGVNTVAAATGITSPLVGITTSVGSQDNGYCDVIHYGASEVRIGGTVNKGAALTSDANGHAVEATATTDRVIGLALADAVAGDIASVLIAPG